MKLSNTEIAELTSRTLSEIDIMQKEEPLRYEALKLGAICKKLSLDEMDLETMYALKLKSKEDSLQKSETI